MKITKKYSVFNASHRRVRDTFDTREEAQMALEDARNGLLLGRNVPNLYSEELANLAKNSFYLGWDYFDSENVSIN